MYRPAFRSFLKPDARTALILILIFSIVRVYLVLQAQKTGSYAYVSLIFVGMILFTFITLDRDGRERIGLRPPKSWLRLFTVLFWGLIASFIMGLAANYNYDLSEQNWFVYIAKSFTVPTPLSMDERVIYFGIFSVISMLFSPIGEELFYRGIIHESLVPRFGQKGASLADAAAFSLVHLAHFGIYPTETGWGFHPYAAFLWVGFMMLTCLVFTVARNTTRSIWGAVAAHAGYNLGMNAIIFFYILD